MNANECVTALPVETEGWRAQLAEGRALKERCEFEAAREWFEAFVAQHQAPDEARMRALLSLTATRARTGRTVEALHPCDEAFRLAQTLEIPDGAFTAKKFKGNCYLGLGLHSEAIQAFQEALPFADQTGDPQDLSAIYNNLGVVYRAEENEEEAHEAFTQALRLCVVGQDKTARRIAEYNMALTHVNLGEAEKARACFLALLPRARQWQDNHHYGLVLAGLGYSAIQLGDYEEAFARLRESVDVLQKTGQPAVVAEVQLRFCDLWLETGRFTEIEAILETVVQAMQDGHLEPHVSRVKRAQHRYAIHAGLPITEQLARLEALRESELRDVRQRQRNQAETLRTLHKTDLARRQAELADRRSADLAAALARAEEAKQVAEEATRLKSGILRMVAHDLRDPLGSMLGLLELADGEDKAATGEYVAMACKEGRIALEMLERLLDSAAVSEGRVTPQLERFELSAHVNEWSRSLLRWASPKDQTVIGLPIAIPGFIEADSGRLRQVFCNIWSNAVKYSPLGGTIVLTADHQGENVVFAVRDSGPGLPPEALETIFTPFSRVLTSKPTGGERATGLGLSIARQLIRLHGGELWAESPGLGHGSTFFISLPLKAPHGG